MTTPAADQPAVDTTIDPNAAPAAAATEQETPQPVKTPADLARDAIYAKASAQRAETGDASEQAMRRGVEALSDTSEAGKSIATPAPAPAAAAKESASTPLAQNLDMVTLTVDGREIQVAAADVWKHGVATLQKQSAADMRLMRAVQAEKQIALEREALDRRAREIEAQRLPANADAASPDANTSLPKGGSPVSRATKEALEALLDSDTDTASKKLESVIAEQVTARLKAAAPAPATPAATHVRDIADPWTKDQKEAANQVFATVFPHILNDPTVLAKASARMQAEMANPINRMGKVDLSILATQIGREFLTQAPMPAPAPAPSNEDALAARRSLAARIPAVPGSSGNRSALNPAQAPAAPSRSEIVQQMRKARGR